MLIRDKGVILLSVPLDGSLQLIRFCWYDQNLRGSADVNTVVLWVFHAGVTAAQPRCVHT